MLVARVVELIAQLRAAAAWTVGRSGWGGACVASRQRVWGLFRGVAAPFAVGEDVDQVVWEALLP